MSYDLMVFQIAEAPSGGEAFRLWFEELVDQNWPAHPEALSQVLRDWREEMVSSFPDANEFYFANPDNEPTTSHAEYICSPNAVCIQFRWSVAELAYAKTMNTARDFGLGFYDVSGPRGAVWGPAHGEYRVLFEVQP